MILVIGTAKIGQFRKLCVIQLLTLSNTPAQATMLQVSEQHWKNPEAIR